MEIKNNQIPLELRHVTFTYPGMGEPVLTDVSLEIHRGEFVGIIGPTGCGKTTLLYLLTGVIPNYFQGDIKGEIQFFGENMRDLSLSEITSKVGMVMQDPEAQLFNLFVEDEVAWGLENRGYQREEMERRISECLKRFQISHLRDRVTYDASGGEKQKISIASIDAIGPEVMIFDNPTSQLDPLATELVFEAVAELTKRGRRTIIMVEDKVDKLAVHADRLFLIHEGKIALDAEPREFFSRKDLLDKADVQGPQVSRLAYELSQEGIELPKFPITLEEAIPIFKELLGHP
jgi:energy-coupling factor transport system ATP-binding protein